MANSKSGRLLAHNKPFNCTDAKARDSALRYNSVNLKSAPPRRGPAVILDPDDAGLQVMLWGQTFMVDRFRVRGKADAQDAGDVNRNRSPGNLDTLECMLSVASGTRPGNDRLFA